MLDLTNGGAIYSVGGPGPRLALLSGLHGDERSGPLALLEWIEQGELGAFLPPRLALWIAPLLNDAGWDTNERAWKGIDLNRSFTESAAPAFVRIVMDDLRRRPPALFMDLHEDSEVTYPFVFRYTRDDNDLSRQLQGVLKAEDEPWSDSEMWEGASEVYVRHIGCANSVTIEAPPSWELSDRIAWNLRAVTWCIDRLSRSTYGS